MNRLLAFLSILFFIPSVYGIAASQVEAGKKKIKKNDKAAVVKKKQRAKKKWNWRKALPEIACLYPAGGQRGTTVEIIVSGQKLRGIQEVDVAGSGVKVVSVTYIGRIIPQVAHYFKYDFTYMLSKKYDFKAPDKPKRRRNISKEDLEKASEHVLIKDMNNLTHRYLEIAARSVFTIPNRLQEAPALREDIVVKLQIDKDAETGLRELRLRHERRGLSNPLLFYISDLPEFSEERLAGPTEKMKTKVKLPAIINGQVMPGETDSFVFQAKKGQRLVFAMMARKIIPYLGDAVPGWFQPVISIHDSEGNEMKFADDFHCSPDPVMLFEVPNDGQYELRVRDSIYRGRKDFIYRIKAGALPFVKSIFPLGVRAGRLTTVNVRGYNLKNDKVYINVPKGNDRYRIQELGDDVFNPVYLAVSSLNEVDEKEDNSSKEKAQKVMIDTIINGRINRLGDVDVFKIYGRAGDKLVFEVQARDLGSPLDALITLSDDQDKQLFRSDDADKVNIGMNTHHADPYRIFIFPKNGNYYLYLRDIQNHGGKDFAYRLRISKPMPDFRAYIGVASFNIRRWQEIEEPVRIVRKDGFKGAVVISDGNEKPLFRINGGSISNDEGKITFQLLDRSKAESLPPFNIQLKAEAQIDGKTVTRRVIPCEDMMQAFIYHHWVPYKNFRAYINRK